MHLKSGVFPQASHAEPQVVKVLASSTKRFIETEVGVNESK
jgi:hypothetical protein